MFNKYYEDELTFLREMGAEFARANPAAAPFLAERGSDPDVERMIEGFAFLTGRLRQKLDDELLELTQSLLQMLWPHYLRPVPAMSILQFEPMAHLVREVQHVPRGTQVDSVPVEGTPCGFRTAYDVPLLPIAVEAAELEKPPGAPAHIRVAFRFNSGAKAEKLDTDSIRFFIHGEPAACYSAYLHLTRRLKEVVLRSGKTTRTLDAKAVRPVGFAPDEALLPYPGHAFPGYRLLQEYFALPQKFLFFEVKGLAPFLRSGIGETFEVLFVLSAVPEASLRISTESLRLHCTPVVNLFPVQSDPIRVDHQRVEYLVRPGGMNPLHVQVFSVEQVKGWVRGTAEPREYPSFHSFRHGQSTGAKGVVYYQGRLRESVRDKGVDTYLSFVTSDQENALPPTETAVADMICTNRGITGRLRVGDLNRATATSPEFAKFKNIAPITPTIIPPLGGGLHWRLISNLSLNYLSLASVEALRGVLGVYNFQALYDRQAARENELRLTGIQEIRAEPEDRLHQGAPIRGTRIELTMKEDNFAGEGEMVLFGGVLDAFFSLYCSLNSYTKLTVRGAQHGEVYSWSPRIGQQSLL